MALKAQLSNQVITQQNSTDAQVTYTCTILDDLAKPLLVEFVSGCANRLNPDWHNIVAAQCASEVNALLEQAATQATVTALTSGLADKIMLLVEGE